MCQAHPWRRSRYFGRPALRPAGVCIKLQTCKIAPGNLVSRSAISPNYSNSLFSNAACIYMCQAHPWRRSRYFGVMKYFLYFTLRAALCAFKFDPVEFSLRYKLLPVICRSGWHSPFNFVPGKISRPAGVCIKPQTCKIDPVNFVGHFSELFNPIDI